MGVRHQSATTSFALPLGASPPLPQLPRARDGAPARCATRAAAARRPQALHLARL